MFIYIRCVLNQTGFYKTYKRVASHHLYGYITVYLITSSHTSERLSSRWQFACLTVQSSFSRVSLVRKISDLQDKRYTVHIHMLRSRNLHWLFPYKICFIFQVFPFFSFHLLESIYLQSTWCRQNLQKSRSPNKQKSSGHGSARYVWLFWHFRWLLRYAWIVWEGRGSVSVVTNGWSHSRSPQTETFLFLQKTWNCQILQFCHI